MLLLLLSSFILFLFFPLFFCGLPPAVFLLLLLLHFRSHLSSANLGCAAAPGVLFYPILVQMTKRLSPRRRLCRDCSAAGVDWRLYL
ncbi:hypothetical protein I3843_16G043000 [Carya illinoinensis]|nr:hypothetical protein I3843_16G043000 [Carya illinoinensis]